MKTEYDTPYICNDKSLLHFGKYKGKTHKVLKDDKSYCEWILSTEDDFAKETKVYIKDHVFVWVAF